jgi:hypothetical protein
MPKKKIIFIIGSPNQTLQMHLISKLLDNEFDCYFTQIFANHPLFKPIAKSGLIDGTVLTGESKRKADKYLADNNLKNDYSCEVYNNTYDLAVVCSDMLLPRVLNNTKKIWVQEGMVDPYNLIAKITKALGLPRYWAMSTALNGSSNVCDIYCTASEGYKNYFTKMGTENKKIVVTGIPNFDNLQEHLNNDFPHKDYVLVATTDIRETYRFENRPAFIRKAVKIANGRPLIFKLHPNEKKERAIAEIRKHASADTLIFTDGNTNNMIANCCELITQYSTVVYVGIILGKKVHSYFDVDELHKLTPIQNNGTSAKKIAEICRRFIDFKGTGIEFLKQYTSELMLDKDENRNEYSYRHTGTY